MNKKSFESAIYLIALIAAAVHGEKAPSPGNFSNWGELLELANKHSVANIVYYPLNQADFAIEQSVMAGFREARNKAVSREAHQELEKEQIAQRLEEHSIRFIFLKGSIMKELYPRVDMRTMADIDILIEKSNAPAVRDILLSLGYEHRLDCSLHDTYYKRPVMNVEIHKQMMDASFEIVNSYFGNGFDRASLIKGHEFRYCLSKEDFYIFLIAHTAKHFYGTGTGIRSILDIYIYLCAYEKLLDWFKISEALKKLELLNFANDISAISKLWFGGEKPARGFEKMEEYIISNGTYGKSENEISNRFIAHYGDSKFLLIRKLRYFVSTAFPGIKYMSVNYPALEKAPVLLPTFWVARLFGTITRRRKNIGYRMKGVAGLKKDDLVARPQYKK
ncbi:MAG: nucleotidyltransferase family protein [Clostridiales bacterium]|nr:nucleotidyltransferase family protein [Clostridiales bacterium]